MRLEEIVTVVGDKRPQFGRVQIKFNNFAWARFDYVAPAVPRQAGGLVDYCAFLSLHPRRCIIACISFSDFPTDSIQNLVQTQTDSALLSS